MAVREKWSWNLSLRKNEGKMGKNGQKWLSQTPQLYTTDTQVLMSDQRSILSIQV